METINGLCFWWCWAHLSVACQRGISRRSNLIRASIEKAGRCLPRSQPAELAGRALSAPVHAEIVGRCLARRSSARESAETSCGQSHGVWAHTAVEADGVVAARHESWIWSSTQSTPKSAPDSSKSHMG
ncbi:hypothetical protein BKA80DRAFT_138094 [Phyllosticta citrichinensis]